MKLNTDRKRIHTLLKEAQSHAETGPAHARLLADEVRNLCLCHPSGPSFLRGEYLEALLLLAECCRREESYEDAIMWAQEAVQLFEQGEDSRQHYRALSILGLAYTDSGQFLPALTILRQSLEVAGNLGDSETIMKACNGIGIVYLYLSEYEYALEYKGRALRIAQKRKDSFQEAKYLTNIGNVYSNKGDEVQALEYHLRALSLVENRSPGRESADTLGRILTNTGISLQRIGDYSQALEYYLRSLAIYEELEYPMYISNSLLNIGVVYKETGRSELAREYLLRSLALCEGIDWKKSTCLINLAGLEFDQGDADKGEVYIREALHIVVENGDRCGQSYALHVLGLIHNTREQYEEVFSCLHEGLSLCREIGYFKGEIDIRVSLGNILERQGKYDEALVHLHAALALTEHATGKPLVLRVHKALTQVYEHAGAMSEAFKHLRLYHELEKELFNESSERRLQTLRILHQVEEVRKEAEIYRLKNNQLEQQVDYQKKELAAKAMYLSQRSDFLVRVRKELQYVAEAPPERIREQVQEVIRSINMTLSDGQSWNAFEEQFRQVHHTFVEILRHHFPSLSATELKVCALLKINLSSKEVGRILNIAARSVDIYRHRIRKKLGLCPDDNLATFITGLH